MTADFLFRILLGHLVGDYLLQSNWMAVNKKKNTWIAGLHSIIWTLCVCFAIIPELAIYAFGYFTPPGETKPVIESVFKLFSIGFLLCVSHYIFDATNILEKYFQLIRGRSYKAAKEYIEREDVTKEQCGYMLAYTALVQTVADNTLHLLCVYIIIKTLGVV